MGLQFEKMTDWVNDAKKAEIYNSNLDKMIKLLNSFEERLQKLEKTK